MEGERGRVGQQEQRALHWFGVCLPEGLVSWAGKDNLFGLFAAPDEGCSNGFLACSKGKGGCRQLHRRAAVGGERPDWRVYRSLLYM